MLLLFMVAILTGSGSCYIPVFVEILMNESVKG
jgi:hypothetical protein